MFDMEIDDYARAGEEIEHDGEQAVEDNVEDVGVEERSRTPPARARAASCPPAPPRPRRSIQCVAHTSNTFASAV